MKKETNCPNCGAPIEAIHDFKQICPYCGTEYKFVPCTTIQFLADPSRTRTLEARLKIERGAINSLKRSGKAEQFIKDKLCEEISHQLHNYLTMYEDYDPILDCIYIKGKIKVLDTNDMIGTDT